MSERTCNGIGLILVAGLSFSFANPTLVPGVWTNITPPAKQAAQSVSCISIDPSNTSTLYAAINDGGGIWKTTDGGSNWFLPGDASDANIWDRVTLFQDDAQMIAVDPNNSNRLYMTHGVRGANFGFWFSTDAGKTWTKPESFPPAGRSDDVTAMAVDPSNFQHVLLGTHACCEGVVMESKDGGSSWNSFTPGIGGGSFGLSFLYHPASGKGNANSWIVVSADWRRTTDAGATWNVVSTSGGVHGQVEQYYTSAGVIYAGGGYPGYHLNRSTDNGATWQPITDGVPGKPYYTICGDGTNLYTCPEGGTYITSPESDGMHWTPYNGGAQTFSQSALQIRFDPVHRIMYATHWAVGLWALKVEGGTGAKNSLSATASVVQANARKPIVSMLNNRLTIKKTSSGMPVKNNVYDITGRVAVRAK